MANKVVGDAESFTDFLGQTVRVGDHVVYATVSDRSPVQKFAVVEKIQMTVAEYGWPHPIKPRVRVGVRELSNGRNFLRFDTYDWNAPPGERNFAKAARVTYPMKENIVLVRTAKEIEQAENPERMIQP